MKYSVWMMAIPLYRRRLVTSPAAHNELHSLELSWAWEPMHSSGTRTDGTGKRSLRAVSNRDMGG
jgi:hypothetical protein